MLIALIPAFIFFFTFYFYLRTHCASFNINDSGETIMVCDQLSISHSPGYPLHTLWGKVNCLLPIGQPMMRVTFSSMMTAALSVVFVYWILKMILQRIHEPLDAGAAPEDERKAWLWEIPSVFGALVFAFSYQHWFQAGGAKGGIYTLNTLQTVCMVYLFFKMREQGWFIKSLLLMGFLYGLSLAHHWPNQTVMAPAYFWFLIIGQKKIPLDDFFWWLFRPFFLICLGLVAIFSWLFFHSLQVSVGLVALMILSAIIMRVFGMLSVLWVVITFGLVMAFTSFESFLAAMACATIVGISMILTRIFGLAPYIRSVTALCLSISVYLFLPIRAAQDPIVNWWNPVNLERLWGTVVRKGYLNTGDVRSLTTFGRNITRFWVHAQHQYGGPVVTFLIYGLAVYGFLWLWRKNKWEDAIGLFFLGFGVFSGIMLFNNPLEGYQWTIDNFFTPVFMTIAIFGAIGVAGICEWCSENFDFEKTPLLVSSVFLGFALLPLTINYLTKDLQVGDKTIYRSVDQSRYVSSYDYGLNMFKCVNRDGVIICNGDIDILPLWYLQHVEHKREEVPVFTMQLIPYDWYRDTLFKQYPFLSVPVTQDTRPETVVQAMIDQHAQERSFYFTNIFTAPWMQKGNPAIPVGFLWRIVKTKGMNYSFTSAEINNFWDTFRLRNLDESDRGYWDEYTDVMKDSYGIGYHYTGFFALINGMPDLAIWGFNHALQYRQPQTLSGIYAMLGESYLTSGNPQAAINNYQIALQKGSQDPHMFARLGDAFFEMKDYSDAQSAYRAALQLNPQEPNGLAGMSKLEKALQTRDKGH